MRIELRMLQYLSTHSCDTVYHVRESKSNLELFYQLFIEFLCHFFGPRLKHMLKRSLKLLIRIPNWFNAFQVLKWFSFLLRVACVICAHVINTDVWQAIIAHATSLWKTVVSHLKRLYWIVWMYALYRCYWSSSKRRDSIFPSSHYKRHCRTRSVCWHDETVLGSRPTCKAQVYRLY